MSDPTTPGQFRESAATLVRRFFPDGLPPHVRARFDQALAHCREMGYSETEAACMAVMVGGCQVAESLDSVFRMIGMSYTKAVETAVAIATAVVVEATQ